MKKGFLDKKIHIENTHMFPKQPMIKDIYNLDSFNEVGGHFCLCL